MVKAKKTVRVDSKKNRAKEAAKKAVQRARRAQILDIALRNAEERLAELEYIETKRPLTKEEEEEKASAIFVLQLKKGGGAVLYKE